MTSTQKIQAALKEAGELAIVKYPDARLQQLCTPIDDFGTPELAELVDRMKVVMVQAKGAGLAANQVGVTVRLFVASGGAQEEVRAYINPRMVAVEGAQEEEEGCLSLPGIFTRIRRSAKVTIEARDVQGTVFQETGEELLARAFEHEIDHLDGRIIVDRMGSVARLAHRRALKQLEAKHTSRQT